MVLTSFRSPCTKMSVYFFAILISKSVSRAIFDTQLVYFIRKLVTVIILNREKVAFASVFAVLMYCAVFENC